MTAPDALADEAVGRAAVARVTRRLLPFLFVLYLFNYLDRTNVAMAALQMNRDLRFSATAYGVGAGVFFVGYALFEVPSNLILARVGARRWIARIMLSWGLVATAMMFVRTPWQFYVLRFLLGVGEAGFFPGIVYYLGQWFPAPERARALARFTIAIPLSGAVGGPLGAALLGLDGRLGLAGWQWLFLVEGVPSALLGVVVLRYLTDRPEEARWLPPAERAWLVDRLAHEATLGPAPHGLPPLRAMREPRVWWLAVPYFLVVVVGYTYSFWGPTLVREAFGVGPTGVGRALAGVAVLTALVMLAVGASADRRGGHALHVAAASGVGAGALAVSALSRAPAVQVAGLAVAYLAFTGAFPAFFALPGLLLRGAAAAVGIAFVNAVGNLGGVVGPPAVGALRDSAGGMRAAYALLCACAATAAVAMWTLGRRMAAEGGAEHRAQRP